VVAVAALAGWIQGWEALVRWLPGGSHMVVNSVLCAFMGGAGFVALSFGRRGIAGACGVVVAVLAALVLLHRVTGWPPGIDELLWKHQWSTPDLPRGQMAVNASAAFVLVGFSLVLMSGRRYSPWLLPVLSGVIIALALLPLLSYGVTVALPGGGSTYRGMAIPTMVCLMAFGGSILGYVHAASAQGTGSLHLMAEAFGMLVSIGIVTAETSVELTDADRWVLHSYEARAAVEHLVSEVARMESSARAYAFTRVRLFHDRVYVHQEEIIRKLAAVGTLLSDNPVQTARIVRLRALAEDKFKQSDKMMSLRDDRGAAAAAQFLATLPTDETSALVNLADEVQSEENRLLAERTGTRLIVERDTHAIQVIGAVFALALLGAAVAAARRANTARTAAEAELRRSEQMFQRLFEGSPDAVLLIERDGRIARVNARAEELFGWSRGTLAGTELQALLPERVRERHGGHLASYLRDPTARPMGTGLELFGLRRGGGEFPVDVMLSPIEAGEGVQVLAVARDISERKRAEADRLVLSKLESTGILAEGIAHDFNNLLTVILLNIDMAGAFPDPEHVTASLMGARKATWAARSLTNQLITFAQGGDPVRRPVNVEGLVRDAVAMATSGSMVAAKFELDPGLWVADVDEGQIAQVLRNLVVNALEASPEGSAITVRAQNSAAGEKLPAGLAPGDYVHLSIVDQGVGIPADIQLRIFDPYFSTKQRGTRKGMGLGLTICYSIIKKHGGDITLESAVGKGTTFHVYLPAAHSSPSAARAEPPEQPGPARRARILVMDDEVLVRETIGQIIGMGGHDVVLAPEGAKAVEAYREARAGGNPFDLVILDLTVREGLGGVAMARQLRAIDPAVKMVVMSGYSDEIMLGKYAEEGFMAALPKPFAADKIRSLISGLRGR
jgi:PAS domain S-box-containing protein